MKLNERQFAVSNRWALAADSLQWILRRQRIHNGQTGWRPVSFVGSTKAVLARCMRENEVPEADMARLLEGLPETFRMWCERHTELVSGDPATQ